MSVDLRSRYLGIELKNPVVVSACPMAANLDTLRRLEDAGAAAAVMPSLFEEQLVHDAMELFDYYESPAHSSHEAQSYFPELDSYDPGPDNYLRTIEAAKEAVDIPIIGSLNGVSRGGWTRYARMIEQAGADAIELNIYLVATDPDASAVDVESRYIELVQAVRETVAIPMAVKIGPFFSSLPNMARRLTYAGADGLVLFNRFLQPDIDLDTLTVTPNLVLSTGDELRLPLRWIAILRGRVGGSLAASSGVQAPGDIIKLLLAGADATMTASSLYRNGPGHIRTLVDGVRSWLEEREYSSVEQMKGSVSRENIKDPEAYERANYVKTLTTFIGGAIWGRPGR